MGTTHYIFFMDETRSQEFKQYAGEVLRQDPREAAQEMKLSLGRAEQDRRVAESISDKDIQELTYKMTEASDSGLAPDEVYAKAEQLINQYYEQGWPEDLSPEDVDRILKIAESTYFFKQDIEPNLDKIAGTPAYNALNDINPEDSWSDRHEAEIDAAATLLARSGKPEQPSSIREFDQTTDDEVRVYLQSINPNRWSEKYLSTPQGGLELYRFTQELNNKNDNTLDFWRHALVSRRQAPATAAE